MPAIEAVIFDFDNTLVNTDKLKEYRERKLFSEITEEMVAETRKYLPVARMLQLLRDKGVKLGIVTNSPGRYVRRLLGHHELLEFFDTIVSYTEVGSRGGAKPSPMGIKMALEAMKIQDPTRAAYVGDDYKDVVAAYRAGVLPIVPSWASRDSVSTPPSIEVSSAGLVELVDNTAEYRLFAERCADSQSTDFNRSQARFLPLDENCDVATIRTKLKAFCLGRYFSQTGATTALLHDNHALSLEITAKDKVPYEPPAWMADMLLRVCRAAGDFLFQDGRKIDLVTVIPSKPGKAKRLELMLEEMKRLAPDGAGIEFVDNLLYFKEGCASTLRVLKARDRHAEQERSLLAVPRNLAGRNIIVIDDVITTGATMNRAIALLEAQGAASVYGVGIAKTVSIQDEVKSCPKCGREMRLQKNKTTGERFWSCNGYFADKACEHAESFLRCPLCDRDLRLRTNRRDNSKFYGCTGYNAEPTCKYTRNA
ncbi:TPA: HAD-IA family hydrolase [Stenotrophomonas maltophilia]